MQDPPRQPLSEISLGGGQRVPYPVPTTAQASKTGKGNRRADTKPEQRLRSELHRRGLRFRKDLLVRADGVRVHVDVAFTRQRVAVFVDGCFWHSCPEHGTTPSTNPAYWLPKLQANTARDRRVDAALSSAGWIVMHVWEHEVGPDAADAIEAMVRSAPGSDRRAAPR